MMLAVIQAAIIQASWTSGIYCWIHTVISW